MSKTIEEVANEYANENMWYPGETSYESDIIAMEDSFADAFKAGAAHVLSLPLSQRLTDEERERVRKMYMQAIKDWIGVGDARGYCRTCIALEEIFGKEMFEKEGE